MKQMTTAYVVRAIEYVEDVACDIRMITRDYSVYSGALCEDTSATAPGSAFEFPPCIPFDSLVFYYLMVKAMRIPSVNLIASGLTEEPRLRRTLYPKALLRE